MVLIADSGSTKTVWKLQSVNFHDQYISTQGINPFHMTGSEILNILRGELIPKLHDSLICRSSSGNPSSVCPSSENTRPIECSSSFENEDSVIVLSKISEIHFYGAGCTPAKIPVMEQLLHDVFQNTEIIEVASDLLGAAKSLCGDSEGIACILGTGANSCLYDGNGIVSNVSPMGYILGDEGSGAVIGKTFINELYKGMHGDFVKVFESETCLSQADIIQKVYREPLANRFLASLSTFIGKHIDDEKWIDDMVVNCFRDFFRKNVSHYNRNDLKVSFVGSIAYYYERQLCKAADIEGYTVGKILKTPI